MEGAAGTATNRVLVIDDDPGVAAVIGRIARRSGYDVIVTADPSTTLPLSAAMAPRSITDSAPASRNITLGSRV